MASMSKNEVSYLVTMLLFRKMMDASILSQEEYDTINTQMKQKYDPKIGTRLNPEFCVNAKQCILKTKNDYDETGR